MKKLVPALIILMVVVFIYLRWNMNRPKYGEIRVNDAIVKVEVADTIGKQRQGLSGRSGLPEGKGMLFPMGLADHYSFWMKDMNFPIDIVWINQGKVVDITENLAPSRGYESIPSASPKEPADTVLEVPAGFCQKHAVKVGDEAVIK